jgi:hypothetical protein
LMETTKSTIPEWFARSVWMLFDLYPGCNASKTAADSWWRFLRELPEDAVRKAFRLAIKASPDRCPTAAQIRAHAEAVAKTLGTPKADLTLPALPEPEPELPADNPFAAKLEAYKRGEIPRRLEDQAAELASMGVGGEA